MGVRALDLSIEIDRLGAALFSSLSPSFFSLAAEAVGVVAVALLKSKAEPGVLGVLVAEPKDAKAPDPRPKAEDPPEVGEATAPAVRGALLLKGLFLPEDKFPKRRD